MSKFKVGDRVRSLVNDGRYSKGDTGTVNSPSTNNVVMVKWDNPRGSARDLKNFSDGREENLELVSSESELERLVRVTNEGKAASAELLRKHSDKVEWDVSPGYFRVNLPGAHVRIKAKPAFEPFYVGGHNCKTECLTYCRGPNADNSGWLVKLEGDTLHVGCKTYPAEDVKRALRPVCRDGAQSYIGALIVGATREGVCHSDGVLPWADADRILAALEKAGV